MTLSTSQGCSSALSNVLPWFAMFLDTVLKIEIKTSSVYKLNFRTECCCFLWANMLIEMFSRNQGRLLPRMFAKCWLFKINTPPASGHLSLKSFGLGKKRKKGPYHFCYLIKLCKFYMRRLCCKEMHEGKQGVGLVCEWQSHGDSSHS